MDTVAANKSTGGGGMLGAVSRTVQPAAPKQHSVFSAFRRGNNEDAGKNVGGLDAPGMQTVGEGDDGGRRGPPAGLDLTGVDWGQLGGGGWGQQAQQMGDWSTAMNAWNANQQGAAPSQPNFGGGWWRYVNQLNKRNRLPMLAAPATPAPPVVPPADTGGLGDIVSPVPPGLQRPKNPNFPWI